jgi:hypothetical protein
MICPLHGQVVINEIHPSPDVNQERVEFVELYNGGTNEVALDGWSLGGGIGYPFPAGARIPAGGFAVVAENPAALSAKFGFNGALGPWSGRLSGNGERITLRDSTQGLVDSVTFGRGFPWPTVGEAPGYSMELIHPGLDNDLGGHWRASITGGSAQGAVNEVLPAGGLWKYLPGTAEASSPTQAWRTPAFDDSTWTSGRLPIGYDPAVAIRTPLTGMSGSFQQIYLRTQFRVTNATAVSRLSFEALYDDGFNLWVNGRLLIQASMSGEVVAFNAAATSTRESDAYDRFEVSVPPGLLNEGENTVAVQVANILLSGSSDCFFDVRVSAVTGPAGRGPTPGQRNVVSETNAPPALRQLGITPLRPRSGDPVRVQVKATDPDGVDSVELEYQVVEPGAYVRFDTPQYASQWTRVPMNDRALGGDVLAGDDVYSVTLPASLQVHRRLIRYRILARDRRGAEVRIPYADDAGRNFAWFVYDGVPAWTGAIRPGAPSTLGNVRTVGTEEMNRLPVYHLIARKEDVEAATWRDRSHGDEYFWTGTLVYDGVVYDHIRFRPRGGGWRYAMGKNMWKFDFNRGHEFEPRDNWGRRMRTPWSKLNLGACIQQGDFEFRGEQGLFEGVGFRLFQLAGQPAGDSAHVQFRIVDSESETNPADQYSGDFWGLYLAVEQPDGRFLAEHGLPDGNLYKMEAGFGDPNNLGPEGPVDSSDLRGFLNAYNGPLAGLSESWWRTNLNLESYFNYQAVVQTIHHYDIADGKNYFYYRNPVEGRWQVIPWDLDLTWADNMYRGGQQGGDEPFKSRVLTGFSASAEHYPAISREFRNRVRELRDLLINTNEAWSLIDEQARLLRGTNALSLVDADRAQWDYNPVMTNSSLVILSKAGHGRFYQRGTPTRDFPGMVQWMKNYLRYRTTDPTFSLDTLSVEPWRPAKPVISYIGSPGFAVDRLSFRTTGFQGNGSLASVRWRIAEVTRTNHPAFRADRPQAYEINPVWDSGELTQPAGEQTFPALDLRVGRLYRARVRHMDAVGRTSNWSDPVEFTAGDPVDSGTLLSGLRLTEIMYNPPADGFEYLEIQNRSASVPIQLSGATFTAGISFVFPENAVLSPGSHALVIRSTNIAGFRSFHGLAESIPIFGPYSGALANEGETVTLRTAPGGSVVFSLAYGIASPWPSTPNGEGFSLVPVNPGSTNLNEASAWRSSTVFGGSPGGPDPDIQSIRLGEPRLESFNGRTVLRLRLSGSYPIPVVVESSNDLRTWTPALTNPVPAELRLSTDPDGAFFRVRR